MKQQSDIVTRIYLVQHAEKRRGASDPELTELGHRQAARTSRWLSRHNLTAVYSSPLTRARQTAVAIATAARLDVTIDNRLRERMNWDGGQPLREFLDDWSRATRNRDYTPRTGDSSHQAAGRLRSFLEDRQGREETIAVITHGGVTTDLLRSLLGDDAIPAALINEGVPSAAITTLDDLDVNDIASIAHLADPTTIG